jgi:hydrogenase-4 membrane subunit HyfE
VNLSQVDVIAAGVAVTAVWMCGVTRIHNLLWIVAVQTGLLAAIAGVHGLHANTPQYLFLAGVVLAIKAFAIPAYLAWAADQVGIRRDAGSVLSPTLALPAGAGTLAMGYFLTGQVAPASAQHPGAAGMALTLLLIGMLLMLTRRLAISQIIGFLVLENGIFLYGLTQTRGVPLVVELGVVLDVLAGVMVAGLVIFRLNRSFEHIDVTQLRGLRD